MSDYPIYIGPLKASRLEDLAQEECGSWEDFGSPEPGELVGLDEDGFEYMNDTVDGKTVRVGMEHAYNIIRRHRTKLELRDPREAACILGHVLENSINKAAGWVEDYRDNDARAWLLWLERLHEKISAKLDCFCVICGEWLKAGGEPTCRWESCEKEYDERERQLDEASKGEDKLTERQDQIGAYWEDH